jgi:hypothetical protein
LTLVVGEQTAQAGEIAWLQQSSRLLRLFFCHWKAKKKTTGKIPSRFLAPQRKYSAVALPPLKSEDSD